MLSTLQAEEERQREASRVQSSQTISSQSGGGSSQVHRVSRDGLTFLITSTGGSRGLRSHSYLLPQIPGQQGGRRGWEGGMNVDQMSYDELLTHFGAGNEQKGAPSSAIDALPVHSFEKGRDICENGKHKKGGEKEEPRSCSVCLDDFGDGDAIRTLPCFHTYHQPCIDRWLSSNNSCPVCKTPIT